jgi:hypothetical protein
MALPPTLATETLTAAAGGRSGHGAPLPSSEGLSPGQSARIDCVDAGHADLADDAFVTSTLERWLA